MFISLPLSVGKITPENEHFQQILIKGEGTDDYIFVMNSLSLRERERSVFLVFFVVPNIELKMSLFRILLYIIGSYYI